MNNFRFYRKLFMVIILISLTGNRAFSQTNISSIAINIGDIRTLQLDYQFEDNHLYTVYSELQLGGSLPFKSFYWKSYYGYWDDHVSEPFPIVDGITYRGQSNILGFNVLFNFTEFEKQSPLDVLFLMGLSRHFIRYRYVGGSDYGGHPGSDDSRAINMWEIGIIFKRHLTGPFYVHGEIRRYYDFNQSIIDRGRKRHTFLIGLSYHFKGAPTPQ